VVILTTAVAVATFAVLSFGLSYFNVFAVETMVAE